MDLTLTPDTYDGVVSALTGNGILCTTVCPTGYHAPPESREDQSHRTQHFVMAGRRRGGPQHPLIDFGTLCRTLHTGKRSPQPLDWKQTLDVDVGVVISEWQHEGVEETTRSCVLLQDNVFLADSVLKNSGEVEQEITYIVQYEFGEADAEVSANRYDDGRTFHYRLEDHLGEIVFRSRIVAGDGNLEFETGERGAKAQLTATLAPGESIVLSSWLHFSDRMGYEPPVTADEIDVAVERHERGLAEFWSRSEVVTGNELVDAFRKTSLYTLRCQATPWSIPPTLSSEYWGGGAFHDELYPFFGLLSSNYPEMAARIPYFRLATLPQARQRAVGKGALYPWSSTEFGEERDPHGHWLTERFHLGQFAVCIHVLWLYEQDRLQLSDFYPVLRELARYFELNMLERDDDSWLGTRACTDFDESVGQVKNGPFTLCAAMSTLACAASPGVRYDDERAADWKSHSEELRSTLKECLAGQLDDGQEIYAIPGGKAVHYSILGPVFPFTVDVDSARARNSAAYIHKVCRSTRGWKPGFSEVFEESNWMWTAGHLGIVHAMQRNADLAWETIRIAPESAGAFLSPNEHRNRDDRVVVPWFTTGCGAWLYALNAMFVQVDEQGTILLPAVPDELTDTRFRNLRGVGGVLLSGSFEKGRLETLTVRAPRSMSWEYRLPERYLDGRSAYGAVLEEHRGGLRMQVLNLPEDEEVSLLV